jgi:hypothetical protein
MATTMSRISSIVSCLRRARRSAGGVQPPSIYKYFPSLMAIYDDVEDLVDRLLPPPGPAVRRGGGGRFLVGHPRHMKNRSIKQA